MTRLVTGGDYHLGKNNVCEMRPQFTSDEEHNEVVFDNLACSVNKNDSLILMGDVAHTLEWHQRISEINCAKITLVPGNHCIEKKIKMIHLIAYYQSIDPYLSLRNCWWSHIPIHPDHLRGRKYNIHAHLHHDIIPDERFLNVSIDHWDLKPVTFAELMAFAESRGRLQTA